MFVKECSFPLYLEFNTLNWYFFQIMAVIRMAPEEREVQSLIQVQLEKFGLGI